MSGTFDYAVNFGPGSSNVIVDGLTFNPFGGGSTITGVSTDPDPLRTFAGSEGFFNIAPNLGGDANINSVIQPLIDANSGGDLSSFEVDLDASNGQAYKMQLIMMEEFFQVAGSRVFDITVDGVTVANNLDLYQVAVIDAAEAEGDAAVVVTYEFVSDGTVDINFSNDTSLAVLSGLTLEVVPEPSTLALSLLGGFGLCARRRSA
ncbi:MAG: malectin domain-containing carbohydrate-binding protein [Planctomycetota bacterium]